MFSSIYCNISLSLSPESSTAIVQERLSGYQPYLGAGWERACWGRAPMPRCCSRWRALAPCMGAAPRQQLDPSQLPCRRPAHSLVLSLEASWTISSDTSRVFEHQACSSGLIDPLPDSGTEDREEVRITELDAEIGRESQRLIKDLYPPGSYVSLRPKASAAHLFLHVVRRQRYSFAHSHCGPGLGAPYPHQHCPDLHITCCAAPRQSPCLHRRV